MFRVAAQSCLHDGAVLATGADGLAGDRQPLAGRLAGHHKGDLRLIPGVERVIDMGGYQEIQFNGDQQRLLEELVAKGSVQLFEITEPSLHDIFIRIAGPEAQEELNTPEETELTIALTDLTVTDPDNDYSADFSLFVGLSDCSL